ncbi:MAG: hypothetical protein IKU45_04015 [Clostridia bacterium]|nr:hypothetical protein [Clostridia bacterium]
MMKIEEAQQTVAIIKSFDVDSQCQHSLDAMDIAIACMQALLDIREEIGRLPLSWEYGEGVAACIEIIDRHIMEIESGDSTASD